MPTQKEVLAAAEEKAKAITDADVFLYCGSIEPGKDLVAIERAAKRKKNKKALLFLTTHGGDPDSAYKIARYFQENYEHFTVVVSGRCKSAGTLIALGANELAFTPYGELGPLDIQLTKVDRFDALQSGLTIQDSLNTLQARALSSFYEMVSDYMKANQGVLSFASATKAASDFITQLYAPIFSRIDPEEVGARARSMRIAQDYGKRLAVKSQNLMPDTLRLLAETYSSHSFVIDEQEAAGLFRRVRDATTAETAVTVALGMYARYEVPKPGHEATEFYSKRYLVRMSNRRTGVRAMKRLTEEQVLQKMEEILKEQMERPALRPHPQNGSVDDLCRSQAGRTVRTTPDEMAVAH